MLIPNTSNQLCVCVNHKPISFRLIREAKLRAAKLGTPLIVLYVETPEHAGLSEDDRDRLYRALELATVFGARVVRQVGEQVAETIAAFCRENDISQLMIGASVRREWKDRFSPSTSRQIVKRCDKLPVIIMGETRIDRMLDAPALSGNGMLLLHRLLPYLKALGLSVLLSLIIAGCDHYSEPNKSLYTEGYNIAVIYLISTLLVAARWGTRPALLTTAVNLFFYNTLFLKLHEKLFDISLTEGANLALFCFASLFAALMGGGSRSKLENLRRKEQEISALNLIHQDIAGTSDLDTVRERLTVKLQQLLNAPAFIFMNQGIDEATGEYRIDFSAMPHLSGNERQAIHAALQQSAPTGIGTAFYSDISIYCLPLITNLSRVGVIALAIERIRLLDSGTRNLIIALAEHSAIALERAQLARKMEESKVKQEKEELRSALLSSLSHDLRTPLASIIGSLSAMRHMNEVLSAEDRKSLTETAHEEAERLDSFISNILNMTRIESGDVSIRREWQNPENLMRTVLRRLKPRLSHHRVICEPLQEKLEFFMDGSLIEQLLQNLVDNAIKYVPRNTTITVSFHIRQNRALITIADEGPGIPPDERTKVFDKFYRLQKRDSKAAGTGLGLAICKAIVTAHEGRIEITENPAPNRSLPGCAFMVTLPNAARILRDEPSQTVVLAG
jgi:two-component system sensor histidine kinase KdpD